MPPSRLSASHAALLIRRLNLIVIGAITIGIPITISVITSDVVTNHSDCESRSYSIFNGLTLNLCPLTF